MKKEKQVKSYQRRTKTGKMVTVKQHTAKYDASETLKKATKKRGAGDELKDMKSKAKPLSEKKLGFTQEEFAEWYEDTGSDSHKKVEKALRRHLGKVGYDALNNHVDAHYKKGGHKEMFSNLDSHLGNFKSLKYSKERQGRQRGKGRHDPRVDRRPEEY